MNAHALSSGKVKDNVRKVVRNEPEVELMVPGLKAPKDELTVAICERSWWRGINMHLCTSEGPAVGEGQQSAADCSGGRRVWEDPELLRREHRTRPAGQLLSRSATSNDRA